MVELVMKANDNCCALNASTIVHIENAIPIIRHGAIKRGLGWEGSAPPSID